jgi:hypothetical protein
MSNKVFKITLTAVYNNDNITEDEISDNVWLSMKGLNNGLIMLNVDDIKENKRPNKAIKSLLKDISIQHENDLTLKDNHVEIKINKKEKK